MFKPAKTLDTRPVQSEDTVVGTDVDIDTYVSDHLSGTALVQWNLHHLVFSRHLLLRLTLSFDHSFLPKGNQNYEIFNTFGSRIYCASVRRVGISSHLTFSILDHVGQSCLVVEANMGCLGRGAGLSVSLPDGKPVGKICQESHCTVTEYNILECGNPPTTILTIKGPSREFLCTGGLGRVEDFAIFTTGDKFIGRISQRWDTLGENFVKDDDETFSTYGCSLPIEMTPTLKSLIMSFLILLDLEFWPPIEIRVQVLNNNGYKTQLVLVALGMLAATILTALYFAHNFGLTFSSVWG